MEIFLLLMLISIAIPDAGARQTDVRWLLQPEMTVKVIEHDNVTLHWLYKRPPYTNSKGKLLFAHHVPGNNYETLLLEGNVHPKTGSIELTHNLYNNRVYLTCRGYEILISITDLPIEEYGRYLLDLRFDSDAAMHDVIDVVVYKDAKWKETPRNEILARASNHVTLKWKRDSTPGQPEIHSITLLYTQFMSEHSTELINTYRMVYADQWETEYPPEGQHLSDRMLHEYNPQRDVFQISFWDLVVEDSGEYELVLNFEDDVTELGHVVSLHVTEASTWRQHPGSDVFGVLSNDVNLTYQPALNSTAQAQKYKLYKFHDKREEEVISISVKGNDLVERRSRSVNFSKSILCAFTEEGLGLLLIFQDIQPDYNGSYLLKMFLEETLAVKHSFHFHVVEGDDLWPTVLANDLDINIRDTPITIENAGVYSFIMPASVPPPYVTMFTGYDADRVIVADIKRADIIDIALSGEILHEGLTVVVDYNFYIVTFKLVAANQKLISQAGVFTSLNSHTSEAVIVYITCFCLLFCNIIVLIFVCCIYKHIRSTETVKHYTCDRRFTRSDTEHDRNNLINENIYEIPPTGAIRSLDVGDGLNQPNKPRFRKSWFANNKPRNNYAPKVDRDWPSGDECEPMIAHETHGALPLSIVPTHNAGHDSSPSILKIPSESPGSAMKRVRWEEQPCINYEQHEQHSPKLPRY